MNSNFYNNIDEIFEILGTYPNSLIVQITDNKIDLSNNILPFIKKLDFSFQNFQIQDKNLNNYLDLNSNKYHKEGKLNDCLFLCLNIFNHDNKEYILQRCYASLKNAGSLVLIFPKNEHDIQTEELLMNCNFVAVNPIEIDENINVYYAKKMHGWGGYR